jgi:DNA-directed RNA polymerase specialized sigma subunit
MNHFERSAIIGYWRSGADFATIGYIMGISEAYVRQIINEYLRGKKENEKL